MTVVLTRSHLELVERDAPTAPIQRPLQVARDDAPLSTAVYLRGDRVSRSDQARYFGQVESGLLAAIRTDSRGQQAVVELHGSGSTVGESNLLRQPQFERRLALEALVPTRVRWIDPASLGPAPDAEMTTAVLAVLATRTRVQHDIACRKRLQSIRQQVAERLVDLWGETVLGSDTPALQHISHFDLARIVGTNRSVVTKVRTEFRHRGWCTLANHDIVGLDIPALISFATRGVASAGERPQVRLVRRQAALSLLVEQAHDARFTQS